MRGAEQQRYLELDATMRVLVAPHAEWQLPHLEEQTALRPARRGQAGLGCEEQDLNDGRLLELEPRCDVPVCIGKVLRGASNLDATMRA